MLEPSCSGSAAVRGECSIRFDLEGLVVETLVARPGATVVSDPNACIEVGLEGVAGDRHACLTRRADVRAPHYPRGTVIRNTRQVSILSLEELIRIAAALELPELPGAWLGANLVLAGIPDLTLLPSGTRLFFPSDAVLVVDDENLPCIHPGKIVQAKHPERRHLETAFPKAAMRLRGVVGWVERAGMIRPDDRVGVALPPQGRYRLGDVGVIAGAGTR